MDRPGAPTELHMPSPRLPSRGILVRTPSSDCVAKRCVKWASCDPQVFEVEEWDRSPCPVTPKLTYRDLVELKQLELDKVPQSPFKSLADLPMPIGLPRVRVGLQPIFDRPTPPATPPLSSSSSSSTSSTSSSSSTGGSLVLHPNTPDSTPVPTPPRSESPTPSPTATSAPASGFSPSRNSGWGNSNGNALLIRRSYGSSSASRYAKTPPSDSASANSSPSSTLATIPPPLPTSFTTQQPAPSSGVSLSTSSSSPSSTLPNSSSAAAHSHVHSSACTHPSPLSQPPSSAASPVEDKFPRETSSSETKSESTSTSTPTISTSPSTPKTLPSSPPASTESKSHPALDLASALLAQSSRTPIVRSNSKGDSVFPDSLAKINRATAGGASAIMSPQQTAPKKKMGGFIFMPLLPPSEESTPDVSATVTPADSVLPTPTESTPSTPVLDGARTPEVEPEPDDERREQEQEEEEVPVSATESSSGMSVTSEDSADRDEIYSRADMMSDLSVCADLISIGLHHGSGFDWERQRQQDGHHHHRSRAPPSEADTDTESTLHSEFDHHEHDHDDARTEVGFEDVEMEEGTPKAKEVENDPANVKLPASPLPSPTSTTIATPRPMTITLASDTFRYPTSPLKAPKPLPKESDSSSSTPSPSPPSSTAPSSPLLPTKSLPAPKTLTNLAAVLSSAQASRTDEDVEVRWRQWAGRDTAQEKGSRSIMGDRERHSLKVGKLGKDGKESVMSPTREDIGSPERGMRSVSGPMSPTSPTPSPASRPRSASASGPAGEKGTSAWDHVAW